jgi:uncharacterized repeat protein (TIGR03803 family)
MQHVGSSWGFIPISTFSAGGINPQARVVFGPDSLPYGTTSSGGQHNFGLVFNLTPPETICKTVNCSWSEQVLYQFTGNPPDGAQPGLGDLVWDSAGNIYGTTVQGGTGSGMVYRLTKSGNNWTETPIYSFGGQPDGQAPYAGVILDSNGNLFGTTVYGGLYGNGTVFELKYVNGIGWTEQVLYNFQNLSDGGYPSAGLIRDSTGNLYGATEQGGGTVFELSPVGDTWVFTLLYTFPGSGPYCGPAQSLSMDNSGSLYGTTFCGGANGSGNIFKFTKTQNGWEYASLHDFTEGTEGWSPLSQVTIDTDGTLYGTTFYGGTGLCNGGTGCGVVWMLKP